ncbi:MAG TPA: response regulator [Nitrososphaeraceae archaeon]|nr:response regulator [Nitrososphaeraceae archaeon]
MVGIIDDELDITQLFHEVLSRIYGISIFTFNDSAKALEHFTDNKDEYVLVISELSMPGINGLELLNKMKKVNVLVRTILMSEYKVNDKLFHQYLKEKIIDKFIKKPIDLDGLYQEVNNQVHAYQLIINR